MSVHTAGIERLVEVWHPMFRTLYQSDGWLLAGGVHESPQPPPAD